MRNTIWKQVQPGQIVSFLYKSKNSSRAEKRTVLCIDPEYTYRKKSTKRNVKLFVGLQLETTLRGPINARTLDQAIRLVGGAQLDFYHQSATTLSLEVKCDGQSLQSRPYRQ